MSTRAQVYAAIRAADAAGNANDVKALIAYLQTVPDVTTEQLAAQSPGEYDPASKEFQKRNSPTGNILQNAGAGAGKFLYDTARGVGQIADPSDERNREIANARERDAPLMATKGGKIGNIGGGVAFTLPAMAIPGINTGVGAAALGGTLGAAQPVVGDESRALNAGVGAAGGYLGSKFGKLLSSLVEPATTVGGVTADVSALENAARQSAKVGPATAGATATVTAAPQATARSGAWSPGYVGPDPAAGLTSSQAESLADALKLGYKTTPGNATGSRALQQLEAKLESQPMTSGPFNAIRAHNQRLINQATAQGIGIKSDVVDSAALAGAKNRLSGIFKAVADQRVRAVSPDEFLSGLGKIEKEYEGLLPPGGITNNQLVKRLFSYAEKGGATGEQLHDLSSKLGTAANGQMTGASGDRQLGMALYDVKEMADDLLQQGLSAADAATFQTARRQYRNLAMLTSQTSVVNPSSGNVNARALASLLQRKDKGGFLYGANDSDMYTGAHFAQAFPAVVGDSGTATRTGFNPLELAVKAPLWAMSRTYASSPSVSLAQRLAAASQRVNRGGMGGPDLGPYVPLPTSTLAGLLGPQLQQKETP